VLDAIEGLPPNAERRPDRAPDPGLSLLALRMPDDDMIANVGVVGVAKARSPASETRPASMRRQKGWPPKLRRARISSLSSPANRSLESTISSSGSNNKLDHLSLSV
jgi:hypothetical protein